MLGEKSPFNASVHILQRMHFVGFDFIIVHRFENRLCFDYNKDYWFLEYEQWLLNIQ